jgi:DNA-binding winged helix-turn-helix (wHTH) protein
MARVWPNTFVEPTNLTVHIAALRRALGNGRDGNRFLINIPGRGYRFVAPVTLSEQFKSSLRATFANYIPPPCKSSHLQVPVPPRVGMEHRYAS